MLWSRLLSIDRKSYRKRNCEASTSPSCREQIFFRCSAIRTLNYIFCIRFIIFYYTLYSSHLNMRFTVERESSSWNACDSPQAHHTTFYILQMNGVTSKCGRILLRDFFILEFSYKSDCEFCRSLRCNEQ